jgi:hypothetical protein
MDVDQRVVVHDVALSRVDEAHPSHIRRQLVYLVKHAAVDGQRLPAVVRLPQIQQPELVGLGWRELVLLDIHAAHPIAFPLQLFHQMSADEAAGAADQRFFHNHRSLSFHGVFLCLSVSVCAFVLSR